MGYGDGDREVHGEHRVSSDQWPPNTVDCCNRRCRGTAYSRLPDSGIQTCAPSTRRIAADTLGRTRRGSNPGNHERAAPSGWRPPGDAPVGARRLLPPGQSSGDAVPAGRATARRHRAAGCLPGSARCAGRAAPRRCMAQAGGVRRGAPVQTGDPRRAAPRCEVTTTGDAPRRSVAPPAARRADRRRQGPRRSSLHTRAAGPTGRQATVRTAGNRQRDRARRAPPCRQAPGVGRTAWATVMATTRATAGAAAGRPVCGRLSTTECPPPWLHACCDLGDGGCHSGR